MAMPTMAVSSPPGYLRASSANTGSTRNSPSMRSAKISARLMLERRSSGVILVELGIEDEEVSGTGGFRRAKWVGGAVGSLSLMGR
ncbi:hypothetical protein SDC9_172317 [bioreactor metagenome]|uniref:Uncharacterized protein n=1 Tax=bioreactor metagenome TaxID=1076179 RepID=A0A645GFU4_9ZZZZ